MTLSITQHNLEKIETLLKALNYKVRYDKGNFKTGACTVENSRIIVVNKFSNLESKILSLSELLKTLDTDESLLNEKQKQFLHTFKQTKLSL